MDQELDDMFSAPTPVAEVAKVENENKPEKFSIWEDEPTPTEYNITSMGFDEKAFTVASFGKVPYQLLEETGALFKALNNRNFILHSGGDVKDKLSNEAEENMETVKYFLPFKKFNPSVNAEVSYPYKKAYDISSQYAFKYENLSNGIKSFIARIVHQLTGTNCNKKINFIIIYTECGKETDVKLDYKVVGSNISSLLKHSVLLNIPVFNLKNPDAVERIKKHIGE